MFKLNHDVTISKVTHKTRKSDDSILKMYVHINASNVSAASTAWLLGLEDSKQNTDQVVESFFDGDSQRFLGIDHIKIDATRKIGSAEVAFANLRKQRAEIGTFQVTPRGAGLSDVSCKITIDEPGANFYEQLLNFEGRTAKCKIEPDKELNLPSPAPKEKQDALDLKTSRKRSSMKASKATQASA